MPDFASVKCHGCEKPDVLIVAWNDDWVEGFCGCCMNQWYSWDMIVHRLIPNPAFQWRWRPRQGWEECAACPRESLVCAEGCGGYMPDQAGIDSIAQVLAGRPFWEYYMERMGLPKDN
jgi:hypothetical protein